MSDGWNWRGEPEPAKVVSLPLRIMPARLPDPASIPPREWLYGTRLIRRFVSVLVAPGGTGKSMFAIGCAMSMASGRALLGDTVHHQVNAWIMNLEDPMEELDRRVAAMMMQHRISREEIEGRLFLHSGRDRRLIIAQPTDYGEIAYPDKDAVIEAALAAQIGYIVVDPLVKSHGLEENSNPHMDAVATAWAEIAQATGAAIDLVHHTRKGATMDADAGRGASALRDASRVSQTMQVMSPEEASELGIADADRWRHVRLDDAKANMAPKAGTARWFKMETVNLGNGTEDYPHGDNVAAITAWEPPDVWASMTDQQANEVLDEIAKGLGSGILYAPSRRGRDASRWAGNILVRLFGISDGQANTIIAAWLKNGVLTPATYRCPEQRKDRAGVLVDNSKRPG